MSWADIVIVVAVIAATYRGISVGALRQLGGTIGFVTGFVIGTMVAPTLAAHVHTTPWRPLVAIVLVIVVAGVGAWLGRLIGAAANLSLRRLKLGSIDRVGGAVVAALGALVACWLIAGLLVNVSFASVSGAIGNSRILDVLDVVMPPVPSVEAKVQSLFRTADFPSVFAEVVAPSVTPVSIPSVVVTGREVGAAATSVVKVVARGACGNTHEGTAFAVGSDVVITAAHVVAGASALEVDGHVARVAVLDKNNDVAVLRVAALRARPLILVASPLPTGSASAVVGYPENGARHVTPAAISGYLSALGRDIYNNELVTRRLAVLSATVEPGNSGSPVLVGGRVTSMVFSKSVVDATVSYAVPASVLAHDLSRAVSGVYVSTGACVAN